MIVLVTGSVRWASSELIEAELDALLSQVELAEVGDLTVLTGMADGADAIARQWAERNGVSLRAELLGLGIYPEPMHRYNEEMLSQNPDLVLAFKEGIDLVGNPDAGTEHMCRIAEAKGITVKYFVHCAQ